MFRKRSTMQCSALWDISSLAVPLGLNALSHCGIPLKSGSCEGAFNMAFIFSILTANHREILHFDRVD